MTPNSDRFRLGDWLVDPSLSRITNGDITGHLEPRAMEVLVFLSSRANELVSKQDLVHHVWKAEVAAHGSLTGIIAQLRNALCDDSRYPKYIETIHTKGYRVIADVAAVSTGPVLRETKTAGDQPDGLVQDSSLMGQAEAGLLHSIEVARIQGTTYAELRAATRLAGLWLEQGRIDEAQTLLQPIVEGFADGIDTLPLLEAKALLWDLVDHAPKG